MAGSVDNKNALWLEEAVVRKGAPLSWVIRVRAGVTTTMGDVEIVDENGVPVLHIKPSDLMDKVLNGGGGKSLIQKLRSIAAGKVIRFPTRLN